MKHRQPSYRPPTVRRRCVRHSLHRRGTESRTETCSSRGEIEIKSLCDPGECRFDKNAGASRQANSQAEGVRLKGGQVMSMASLCARYSSGYSQYLQERKTKDKSPVQACFRSEDGEDGKEKVAIEGGRREIAWHWLTAACNTLSTRRSTNDLP